MLSSLKVQNFVLIDLIELHFNTGLTVITGETGSGKSILLGALNLLLGERADYSLFKNEAQKIVVEGIWEIGQYDLKAFFDEHDLDYDNQCIIRRDVLPHGKSRAFINDTPVSLQLLKELTSKLIQINSQHHIMELKDKGFQLSVLDELGDTSTLFQAYSHKYATFKGLEKRLNELRDSVDSYLRDKDYKQFQLDELRSLNLESVDFSSLLNELKNHEHGEEISSILSNYIAFLESENLGIAALKRELQPLKKLSSISSQIAEWYERMQSQLIEMEDTKAEIVRFLDSMESSPEKLQRLLEQADTYNRMLQKHRRSTQEELKEFQAELEQSFSVSNKMEEELKEVSNKRDEAWEDVLQLALQLSELRKKAAPSLKQVVEPLLSELKMPDAQIDFYFHSKAIPDKTGAEAVDLLFSPNQGVAPSAVEKSASGGELARFMLVLQVLLSNKKQLPAIIFDEIDTGVSGDVADRVGKLLRRMGKTRQLIAITHLPQVAAAGNQHLKVSKTMGNQSTQTNVVELNAEQRIEEIAQLMSGEKVNQAAKENAKHLLNNQL